MNTLRESTTHKTCDLLMTTYIYRKEAENNKEDIHEKNRNRYYFSIRIFSSIISKLTQIYNFLLILVG